MKMKKVCAALLAATMVMSGGLTVCAAGSGSAAPAAPTESAGSSNDYISPEYGSGENYVYNNAAAAGGSVSEAVISSVQSSGAVISIAGSKVKTSVAGAYAAKSVQGVAVTTPLADVKANLGLTGSQTPYITVFDTDQKKSHMAMACVNAAVNALGGGKVAAVLNIDLGAKDKGKFVTLSNGSVGMVVGLPKGVDTSKTIFIVCVRPGGKTTVLQDTDSNPNTVTFNVEAGLGTYAIVAK